MNKALKEFDTHTWGILKAPVQSGKTFTFLLLGLEMLRLKRVSHVVIISGTNETILRTQTLDNIQKIKASYRTYLDALGIRCGRWRDLYEWVDETDKLVDELVDKIEVAFGSDLKKFKLYDESEKTLYIWEESHYAQSENQEIDKFFRVRGIQPTGTVPNGFMLSVSATPFSELSDLYHLKQHKFVVQLDPGDEYMSIKKMMQKGQTQTINDLKRDLPRILERHLENKYILMRATEKKQAWMIPLATLHGFTCVKFDMTTTVNLDTILSIQPLNPTIVFFKQKCRMGKNVEKTHVSACIETSMSKTDALTQGLLGRMSGFKRHDIIIYIFNYNKQKSGLDKYNDLHDGNNMSIAPRAMNIRKTEDKQLRPIIPVKLTSGVDPEHCDMRGILQQFRESHISPLEEVGIFQANSQQVWNDVIVPRVLKHVNAYLKHPSERSPEEQISAAGCKVRYGGAVYNKALPEIQEAWRQNIERCAYGSGAGAGVSKDEVIFWFKNDENVCYITMQYEDSDYVQVPKTTRNEIFCRNTTTGGAEFTIPPETRTQPYKCEEVLDALIEASRLLNVPVLSSNGYGNHILMTEQVFNHFKTVIEKWRPQTTITFKMVSGRRPVGVTDVRIASITWTKLRA